jgi:L-glutamine-phosphate cytidylyltransferase
MTMRAIIIGAGRGSRLGHETTEIPKTMVEVMGRPMLDWILEALAAAGFQRKDVVFICGYAQEVVRKRYPEFTFVENTDWPNNNILASLFYAREHFGEGFVSSYADIVYDGDVVKKLVAAPDDIALGCDTAWRRRYVSRTQHPETDAEKLRADGRRVLELGRKIASEAAQGEFIGVMKLSGSGARELERAYDRRKTEFAGRPFREGRSWEKAYLIDLLQDMLESGSSMHREDTPGGYMEIDTLEDMSMAERWWKQRP